MENAASLECGGLEVEVAQRAFLACAQAGRLDDMLALASRLPELVRSTDPVNRWTALHVAARNSDVRMLGALISLGAEVESRDAMFRSALHFAARADGIPTRSRVASGTAVGSSGAVCEGGEGGDGGDGGDGGAVSGGEGGGEDGREDSREDVGLSGGGGGLSAPSPSTASRAQAMLACLRALLKAGARVTARDQFGFTALHHASQAGHAAAIEFLLSLNSSMRLARAPIEAETNAEERPLHLAAAGAHNGAIRCLLEHGAHPCKTNYLGQTPLHLAVAVGDQAAAVAAVNLLCQRQWKVDVNAAAADGRTPLHDAAAAGHTAIVRALLRAPNTTRLRGGRAVDVYLVDRSGCTAAQIARANGFEDVAEVVEAHAQGEREREARAEREKADALVQGMRQVRLNAAEQRRARATASHGSMSVVHEGMDEAGEEESEEAREGGTEQEIEDEMDYAMGDGMGDGMEEGMEGQAEVRQMH